MATKEPKSSKPMTAAEMQSLGGKARAAKLTREQRVAAAKKTAGVPRPNARKNPNDPKWRTES